MWEHFKTQNIKKTRKPHVCIICGLFILEGYPCRYTVGKFDGDFSAYYECEDCLKWMEEHPRLLAELQDEEGYIDFEAIHEAMKVYHQLTEGIQDFYRR